MVDEGGSERGATTTWHMIDALKRHQAQTAALAASRPAVLERAFRGELWCLPPSSPLFQKFDERFRVINIDLA
jgi:hypothetical protein